jgi:hypothetical protein
MTKNKWIQDAIKHRGALRKTATKKGLIKGDEKLSMTDLNKLEKEGGKTAKQAALAKTLRKFEVGGVIPSKIVMAFGGLSNLRTKYGAYDFVELDNGLTFKIRFAKTNFIKITLNNIGLYNLEIGTVRGSNHKITYIQKDLQPVDLKWIIDRNIDKYTGFKDGGITKEKKYKVKYLIGYTDEEDDLKYQENYFYSDSQDDVALRVFEHFKRLGYTHIEILGISLANAKNNMDIKFASGGGVGSKRDSVINYYINNMEDDVLMHEFDINESYLVDRNENYSKIYDIISDELDDEDVREAYGELNLGDDGDPYEMAKGGEVVHKEYGIEYYKDDSLIEPTKDEKLKWEIYGLPKGIVKKEQYFETIVDEFNGKTKKEIEEILNKNISSGKYNYLGSNPNLQLVFKDKMADGGKINDWFEKQRKDIINKSPFHIEVNNFDCAKKIKNKNSKVEIIKLVNPRVKQPISYVLVIKNWTSVDELKNIFTECSNHIISYGFTSNEQIDIFREMASRDVMADGGFVEKSDEELKGMNDDELFEYLDAKAAYMKQFIRPLSSYKAKNYAANTAAIQYQNEGTAKLDENFPDIQKIKEQSIKDYEETIAKRKDKMSDEEYKKGGALKYYDKENEYKIGRPSGYIEKEILSRVNFSEEDFVGSFGWKTEYKKLADGYLYKLSDFDKELVKNIKLKSGEKIFRYFNRRSAIGGMKPLIKINVDKELLYFLKDNDNDIIEFETRGIQALWIALIEHKLAKGGALKYYNNEYKYTMKTAMQELIDELSGNMKLDISPGAKNIIELIKERAESRLEKEKEQLVNAYDRGYKEALDKD